MKTCWSPRDRAASEQITNPKTFDSPDQSMIERGRGMTRDEIETIVEKGRKQGRCEINVLRSTEVSLGRETCHIH
jgi:hypothetical protein